MKEVRNIPRQASLDIANGFKDQNADRQRFSITVAKDENCSISSPTMKGRTLKLEIPNRISKSFQYDNGALHFDSVVDSDNTTFYARVFRVKEWLVFAYRLVIPVLAIAGLVGYLFGIIDCIRKSSNMSNLGIVATSLWVLFFSRVALIVLVDISSFPAINVTYLSPAFPLLCLASLVSIAILCDKKREYKYNISMIHLSI